ncbi:hypothetical protein B0H13DRAFT_1917182 [Mycena leptocephala]|nr:hypothetical protein B0H13DRAFT_1917182 [Mycena leptocephala]
MLTHYDTFVNSFEEHCDKCKNYESCEKCKNTETSEKHEGAETCENCKKAAKDGYDGYVQALEKAVTRLNIPMPECINVSLREGYTQNILLFVDKTEKLVENYACLLWATAQRIQSGWVSVTGGYPWFIVSVPLVDFKRCLGQCSQSATRLHCVRVGLTLVLRELLDWTLQPNKAGRLCQLRKHSGGDAIKPT